MRSTTPRASKLGRVSFCGHAWLHPDVCGTCFRAPRGVRDARRWVQLSQGCRFAAVCVCVCVCCVRFVRERAFRECVFIRSAVWTQNDAQVRHVLTYTTAE